MASQNTSQAETITRKPRFIVTLASDALVSERICSAGPKRVPRRLVFPPAFAVLISLIFCFCASLPSFAQDTSAQDTRTLADFTWKKDVSTGNELAASRSESSFNFFDVGDLSYYSQYLVEQDLRRLSAAAGLTIDRTKNSSVSIVHDTKVFERLKNDKPAFKLLGFSDYEIATLEKQVTSDSPKCLTVTITDGNNGIATTVMLLSEKFDSCLVGGLLNSFGIAASDINAETLIDVCVLYEGRRLGLRDRQGLAREASRLRNVCIAKAGEIK
jgi:hypothetical protein